MSLKSKTEAALQEEGMSIEDYESGAVLVFVDHQLLSDSDELADSQATLARAKSYGELGCWLYIVP